MALKRPGLEALIKEYNLLEEADTISAGGGEEIAIGEIVPSPFQPRRHFDPLLLEELAASIKVHGIISPILVRKVGDKYQLVAGERRWRAAQIAGLTSVKAVVADLDDLQVSEIVLVENIQRSDLSPVEEARGYRRLIDELGYSQENIARRVGKSRPHIANLLRLLSLPKEILVEVEKGALTMGQVKPLIGLKDSDALELASRIKKTRMSARQVEGAVKGGAQVRHPELAKLLKELGIDVHFSSHGGTFKADDESLTKLTRILKNHK